MRKIRLLIILGLLLSIMPYLGFTLFIKNLLISILGILVIYLSYLLYSQNKKLENKKPQFENFSENHDFAESIPEEKDEITS